MGVTLEDVGRRCGVSRSTVSRVINESHLVNAETREKVLRAIRELNYAPNFIARSLTKNTTETLAVILPDITGGFFPEILAGMDEVAGQRGYHLLIVFFGGTRPPSDTVEKLITHRRVDAVLAVAETISDEEAARMAEQHMPLVCVGRRTPVTPIPSVTFDDRGGAWQGTQLLIAQGRRNLIHLRGPAGNYDAEERSRGFRTALEEAGIAYEAVREIPGDFRREGGLLAIREVLQSRMAFDGIFAANDEMAIGALEVLTQQGIRVPADVAVVGFDNIPTARYLGLTTVRVPVREMGRVAVRLAFDLIDGRTPVSSEVLQTDILQRASTQTDLTGGTVTVPYTPSEGV